MPCEQRGELVAADRVRADKVQRADEIRFCEPEESVRKLTDEHGTADLIRIEAHRRVACSQLVGRWLEPAVEEGGADDERFRVRFGHGRLGRGLGATVL